MNILLCSYPYAPSVGGIETVSALLAEQFYRAGHDVAVVTQTASSEPDNTPWRIARRPAACRLVDLHRWADVVLHNNISLRMAWPLLLVRRPWVVGHHTWLGARGHPRLAAMVKRALAPTARHVAVSAAVALSLPVPADVVPNPYASDVFKPIDGVPRDRDLVFVGRLVSDKGVPVLLDALAQLHRHGLRLGLSIVGEGPDRPALEDQVRRLGLGGAVRFEGRCAGRDLVELLHRHRVCVVPSVWEEPFGLVVLEALACGCVPVVARSGGLPDAAGPCGVVVPKGDATALAKALRTLLADAGRMAALLNEAPSHLSRHRCGAVARHYLEILDDAHRTRRVARRAA